MWTLPPDLAGYFNDFVKEFYDDDDLRDEDGNCIKEKHPVPENIQKVPKLDTFVEEDWKDKKYLVEGDGDVARIQQRLRDVMGPLSKVWKTLEDVKKKPDTWVNIKELAQLTEHSILLLAQASNAATYKRRIDVLKVAHGSRHAATSALKRHSETLLKSGDDLFGQEFKKVNKSTLKDSKDAGALLGKSSASTSKNTNTSRNKNNDAPREPFRNAPSSGYKNHGGRGGGKIQFRSGQNKNFQGKGKYPRGRNLIQFACTTESKMHQQSPSLPKENISGRLNVRENSICRENTTLPEELASPHKGQEYPESDQGLGNPTLEHPTSGKTATSHSSKPTGNTGGRLRGTKHVGKGSYQGSNPQGIQNVE